MITIKNYDSASELPAEWDSVIGDNLYLSREFVSFMESVDKCGQKYYMLYDDGVLDSVFMTCVRKKYNLAMFTKLNLFTKMTLVYVPLSVTRPGVAYGKPFELKKEGCEQESVHIEYDYPYGGDVLDITVPDDNYWVYPLTKRDVITKISLATEEIFAYNKEKMQEKLHHETAQAETAEKK